MTFTTSVLNWGKLFVFFHSSSVTLYLQGYNGSRAYRMNTGGGDTPCMRHQSNTGHHAHRHTFSHTLSHLGMFWDVPGSGRTQRKPTCTLSSLSNCRPWSYVAATLMTAPLWQPGPTLRICNVLLHPILYLFVPI